MASTTTTTTTFRDKKPASSSVQATSFSTQRRGILSLDTSTPRLTEHVESVQSPAASNSAQPHPQPHRTFSGPAALPSSSIQDTLAQNISPITPKSADPRKKTLRWEKGDNALTQTSTSPGSETPKREDLIKRRHSADPKMNVHTECGRHSDSWLFTGWNVSGTVKRLWEKPDSNH